MYNILDALAQSFSSVDCYPLWVLSSVVYGAELSQVAKLLYSFSGVLSLGDARICTDWRFFPIRSEDKSLFHAWNPAGSKSHNFECLWKRDLSFRNHLSFLTWAIGCFAQEFGLECRNLPIVNRWIVISMNSGTIMSPYVSFWKEKQSLRETCPLFQVSYCGLRAQVVQRAVRIGAGGRDHISPAEHPTYWELRQDTLH